jgi:hypothetical protein
MKASSRQKHNTDFVSVLVYHIAAVFNFLYKPRTGYSWLVSGERRKRQALGLKHHYNHFHLPMQSTGGIHEFNDDGHVVFEGYIVQADSPGLGFYLFVGLYSIIVFVSVPWLVSWSKSQEERKLDEFEQQQVKGQFQPDELEAVDEEEQQQQQHHEQQTPGDKTIKEDPAQLAAASGTENNETIASAVRRRDLDNNDCPMEQQPQQQPTSFTPSVIHSETSKRNSAVSQRNSHRRNISHHKRPDFRRQASSSSSIASGKSTGLRSIILRELDQSYPDQDPEFLCRLAIRSVDDGGGTHIPSNNDQKDQQQKQNNISIQPNPAAAGGAGSKAPTEASSGVPSAATTTQLQNHRSSGTTGSTVPVAVTTDKRLSRLVLDVNSRRWKSRRPIGRADVIQNAIANEINSVTSGRRRSSIASGISRRSLSRSGIPGMMAATGDDNNKNRQDDDPRIIQHPATLGGVGMRSLSKRRTTLQQSHRGMSDVASSILSEQHHQLHQPSIQVDISQLKRDQRQQQILQFQQQQHHTAVLHRLQALQRQQYQRSMGLKAAGGGGGGSSRRGSWLGGRSVVSQSNRSVMSSIVDDISPEDAADANDPGRGNVFVEDDNLQYLQNVKYRNGNYQGFGVQAACLTAPIETLLRLAVPDDDKWHVVRTSILLSIGASSESLFRLISAAFISQYLGTESMVAFLLVGLFVRLTSEELAGAIVDALSSYLQVLMNSATPSVQGSNDSTRMYIAGQYVQLACIVQLVLQIPLLIVWAVCMEPVVLWFTSSSSTAVIAQDYTVIVIFAYLISAMSRTLTVIFHICGHEHFESVIDLAGSTLQVVAIACIISLVDGVDLTTVAYIQVLITITSAITKIVFPVLRGWMRPIRRGLIQNMAVVQNRSGLPSLLHATFFLVCGAILEYGQWELLTIFVRFLGPAEGKILIFVVVPRVMFYSCVFRRFLTYRCFLTYYDTALLLLLHHPFIN